MAISNINDSQDEPKTIRIELSEEILVTDQLEVSVKPFDAFQHNISLAGRLLGEFPEMSLVMSVAAFEIFFKQELGKLDELAEYLIKNRRLRLQNRDELKEIVKAAFGINLPGLDANAWKVIAECIPKRHAIIHNAGFDDQKNKVMITSEEARKCIDGVQSIVSKTKGWLEEKEKETESK